MQRLVDKNASFTIADAGSILELYPGIAKLDLVGLYIATIAVNI